MNVAVNNRREVRCYQTRAADQKTVYIPCTGQIRCIAGIDAAAIKNTHAIPASVAESGHEKASNPSVYLGYLLWACIATGANRPDWFVGNLNVAYIIFANPLQCKSELAGNDGRGPAFVAFIESLAHAQNRADFLLQHAGDLSRDYLIGLMEHMAAFRVADDDVLAAEIAEH